MLWSIGGWRVRPRTCADRGLDWICPTSRYINNILRETPTSVDQVIIEPNGEFHTADTNASPKHNGEQESGEEDEDLLEISKMPRISATSREVSSMIPPGSSREHSAVTTTSSAKRPIGQVIDLTFSSDEDEPPRPPKKRSNPSYPTGLHRYPSSENFLPTLRGPAQPKQMPARSSLPSGYNPWRISRFDRQIMMLSYDLDFWNWEEEEEEEEEE